MVKQKSKERGVEKEVCYGGRTEGVGKEIGETWVESKREARME